MCTSEKHDEIKRDVARWRALPFVGVQEPYDDERPNYTFECRNCNDCGTTLMVEVPR